MTATWTAKRLPVQPGPAGWNRLLPDPPPARLLEADSAYDVAIIGAGFAGLSAARRLGQLDPGVTVAVLEAGRIADGPAGRNSGFMIDLPHDISSDSYVSDTDGQTDGQIDGVSGDREKDRDSAQTWLNRRAIGFAKDIAESFGFDASILDPCGKINAAASPGGDQHNREYAEHLASMNEQYRLLDGTEMEALTGTTYYTSGLFTPGTVMLQPAAYIRGLGDGLRDAIDIFENTPALKIEKAGQGWRIETPKAKLSAKKVILANNGHAESFGFFARRLMHIFTYASMTEAFEENRLGGDVKWGVTPADPMGTTVRRIQDGDRSRLVVRTRFTYNPSMTVSDGAVARAGRVADRKFAERFPNLSGVAMEHRWAGHLCLSMNGMPAHGEIEDNLFAAVCQNGLGTVKGTLAGMVAAELALEQPSDMARMMQQMDQPSRLPPEPFAWIGANATLRWKEWRAGRE